MNEITISTYPKQAAPSVERDGFSKDQRQEPQRRLISNIVFEREVDTTNTFSCWFLAFHDVNNPFLVPRESEAQINCVKDIYKPHIRIISFYLKQNIGINENLKIITEKEGVLRISATAFINIKIDVIDLIISE